MKYFSRDRFCNFNLHYDSFYSLEYFFRSMQKLGVKNCELIAGHQSLYMDHESIEDLTEVKRLRDETGVNIAVITAQNCRFPYQYAAKEKELVEMTYAFFANGLRMAAELGADVVKAFYTENFDTVVANCPVPIILAGGPKGSDIFDTAAAAVKAGVKGFCFGRNLFQSEDKLERIARLDRILREA